jgi:epoxyqueuosine reductase
MDASRCIAYLTIEKKGLIDQSLREPMGRQVFGCDICQDVCPWNRKSSRLGPLGPVAQREGMAIRSELINPALEWLAAMGAKEFKQRFKGSPLERTGRKSLLRNIAIAMGNSGEERFLPQLAAWVANEAGDATAEASLPNANDLTLREAAKWAREAILARSSSH